MLKERQKIILEFCAEGKTSFEIAEHIGMAHSSVYPELTALQRLGLIQKNCGADLASRFKQPAIFVTIGDALQIAQHDHSEYDPELVNVEFIKHSHNIWRAAA